RGREPRLQAAGRRSKRGGRCLRPGRARQHLKFVLYHSPLVGPSTWRWVGEALEASGDEGVVPDLRHVAAAGSPHRLLEMAVDAVPASWGADPVLVAHSGLGSLLPSIAAGTSAPGPVLVFVDAGFPPCQGSATPSADFLEQLRS